MRIDFKKLRSKKIGAAIRAATTKRRLIAATVAITLILAVFIVGVHRGYRLGFTDGEKKANCWWIDKKSRYYESSEIRKSRLAQKFNEI
jgi:hypothetical protein